MKEKRKSKKKSKKHKSKKRKQPQSDSDSPPTDEDEWEEASHNTANSTPQAPGYKTGLLPPSVSVEKPYIERDDWTTSASFLDTACNATSARENKTKERKTNEKRVEEESNQKIYRSRELNPFIKNSEDPLSINEAGTGNKESAKINLVGDRGQSWIRKAYERAKEQARDENIPLEDIVIKRWGSMDKLNALLRASDRTSRPPHSTSSGWRKHIVKAASVEKQSDHESSPFSHEKMKTVHLESNISNSHESLHTRTSASDRSERIEERDNSYERHLQETHETTSIGKNRLEKRSLNQKTNSLTEEEKNQLNAKLLRAELMGDEESVDRIKRKLSGEVEKENDLEKNAEEADSSLSEDEEVILTRSDKHGNLYPVKLHEDDHKLMRKKKIMSTHDESGKRVRYFEDDDKVDLKAMVEQERLTSADDHQAMLSRLAGKHLGRTMGDDYTIDDMFVAASATKGENAAENRRVKQKAIAEHKQHKKQLTSCQFCFESSKIAKHLVVTIGVNIYLSLPANASLVDGHCLIVPLNHIPAQTFMDENVEEELKKFKSCLVRMFGKREEDVMFMETCKNLSGQFHCVVECIPVPRDVGNTAPLYFKKAITESESEWSQNKKLVSFAAQKGLTKSVPKGLPYFAVEFGMDGGFAHIIEEESFPIYFGREVIGGMMDLYPGLWLKPPKESFEQQKRKLFKFMDDWKSYDWAQQK